VAFDVSTRRILLVHDGELADVAALVSKLGAEVVASGPDAKDFDVAVATPRRLNEIAWRASRRRVVRIAVVEQDARTVRAMCRRAGIDLVVRRPVHPSVLRLLLLHALYRGPDRRVRRVAVGAPVRFRVGLRFRTALLADLSTRGCRLLACTPLPVGRRVSVYVPDPGLSTRTFSVGGRVTRAIEGTGCEEGFAVAFDGLAERTRERLREAVDVYAGGTVPFAEGRGVSAPDVAPGNPAAGDPFERDAWEPERGSDRTGAPTFGSEERVEAGAVDPGSDEGRERRRAPRHAYQGRRVVALDEEAARVLIGSDVSLGGMRVAPTPDLRVGQHVRIALHGSAGDTPLVMNAVVTRDDGERGLVLAFGELPASAERYLAKLLESLPVLEACREVAEGVLVSEILDTYGS
jgi:hypothetical protein